MRWVPAVLVPAGVIWSVDAAGVIPAFGAVAAAASATGAAAWWALRSGIRLTQPVLWAGLLVTWSTLAIAIRPVCTETGMSLVAAGTVAVTLLAVAGTPRGRFWGGLTVTAAGVSTAAWLLAEALWRGGRPGGPSGNPNLSAAICLLALATLPAVRLSIRGRAIIGAGLLAGVAASGSRGAALGAVGLALCWAVGRPGRVRLAAVSVAAVALLAGGIRLGTDPDPLRWERVRIWSVAMRTIQAELPLGAGPGGFADAALRHNFPREGEFARYHRWPELAESDWLQLLATLGFPGLILLLGLGRAVARSAGLWTSGVLVSQGLASSVNTLLASPAVLWTAALALGVTLSLPARRDRSFHLRLSGSIAGALCLLVAATTSQWLMWPLGDKTAEGLVRRGAEQVRIAPVEPYLGDGELLAAEAVQRRPRFTHGWQTLGWIRLARAEQSADLRVLSSARAALEQAVRHNPNAPFAVLGLARVQRRLGDAAGARGLLQRAIALEPNFVRGWVELADLELQSGRLEPVCQAIEQVRAVLRRADQKRMVSDYERALVQVEPQVLKTLEEECNRP